MTVGLLGILKAGGAYLPLDPQLPAGALAIRARRCGSPHDRHSGGLRNFVPDWKGAAIFVNDEQSGTMTATPECRGPMTRPM